MNKLATLLCVFTCILGCNSSDFLLVSNQNRVFEIDWNNNQFLKDGEPFRYISGSVHYFRQPRAYWEDRLRKLRAAGLNAVSVYIEWSYHEPYEGVFDFTGERDFVHFIKLAQALDLLVILRPGPFICAERDFGGYPSWLLSKDPNMKLRTNDTEHTKYVYQWLKQLFPIIQPLLYGNGGPIIMVQVENEYGSYNFPDRNYTKWLRDVFRSYVGDKAVLFTTDGPTYLQVGTIPGVFATVDFSSTDNVELAFEYLRKHQSNGPLVNSEFYTGWLTHWGEPFQTASTDNVIKNLEKILKLNASVNLFMFAGGTSFGFTSGSNYNNRNPVLPQVTSYDFDAPINEGGDPTHKFYAIRDLISRYAPLPPGPIPQPKKKGDYGSVKLLPKVSIFDAPTQYQPIKRKYPISFEALNQSYGFILYETRVPKNIGNPAVLFIKELHDRALVYVDKIFSGLLSRAIRVNSTSISVYPGQTLSLLVENQGRINYFDFRDPKGILSNVTLNGSTLDDWTHTLFPLSNISQIEQLPDAEVKTTLPTFYTAKFKLPYVAKPLDTYVNMSGWGKGVLFVNQFNLGRYWPTAGPQVTLYLPGCYLRPYPAENEITIFEMEFEKPDRTITFIPTPILNGTIKSEQVGFGM